MDGQFLYASLQLLLWDLANATHRRVTFRSGLGIVCVLLWHLVTSFCAVSWSHREGQTAEEDGLLIAAQLLSEHVTLPSPKQQRGPACFFEHTCNYGLLL